MLGLGAIHAKKTQFSLHNFPSESAAGDIFN